MRSDMAKVIVERERVSGCGRKAGKPKFADATKKESMKRRHYNRKELNENLQPLIKYLHKNVGKPWNKVFSDICKNINLRNAVQKHIRDHVKQYVLTKVFIVDGVVYHPTRDYEITYKQLYVCPTSGILKEYKKNRYKKWTKADYEKRQFVEDMERVSSPTSTTFVDGTVTFKVYPDKVTGGAVYHKANATHARIDFAYWKNSLNGLQPTLAVFGKYPKLLESKEQYWVTYRKLLSEECK